MIREVEKPNLKQLFMANQERTALENLVITGSGKGSIAIILKYLQSKNIITNKLDEIIVPDWIGYWVYNQIQSYAFPAKQYSPRSKAIMVYHQYGYPQDMHKIMEFATQKNLVVIEDCAHAIDSQYKGKQVGTFGDFSIYSFSKWFFCFALGGVTSKHSDFKDFAMSEIKQTPFGATFFKDFSKYIYEKSSFSKNNWFKKNANLLLNTSYALYDDALRPSSIAQKLFNSKIDYEIKIRKKRYQFFLEQTKHLGICDHLEKDGITPYVIPIIVSQSKQQPILNGLNKMGVNTDIYNFDVNRNILDPKFVKTIWIPCHASISSDQFAHITRLIIDVIKK
ncbi:MAG: DegT/DnrJ/EryC1/StrS family aminotransferase [Candidatus Kuenenbacteria bacterium]